MKIPILKNHFVVSKVVSINDLLRVLATQKSIFVRSYKRVHPCQFFINNEKRFDEAKLQKMIDAGDFWEVVPKKSVTGARLRSLELGEASAVMQNAAPTMAEAAKNAAEAMRGLKTATASISPAEQKTQPKEKGFFGRLFKRK